MRILKFSAQILTSFDSFPQEYEKVQSRVNRQSRQRLTDSKVRIIVTADAQIAHIKVYVERAPMAATLSGDVTGRVPLNVKMGAQVVNKVSNYKKEIYMREEWVMLPLNQIICCLADILPYAIIENQIFFPPGLTSANK